MERLLIKLITVCITLGLLIACENNHDIINQRNNQQEFEYKIPVKSNDGWQTASLHSVGIDEARLELAVNRIRNNIYQRVHGIVITRFGKLVFEEYFEGNIYVNSSNLYGDNVQFTSEMIHNLGSATKSITATLAGLAINYGFIEGEDQSIFDFFPEYTHLRNNNNSDITVKHLLTMTAGWRWNENTTNTTQNDLYLFNTSPDPVEFMLSRSMIAEPGTSWLYSGGSVSLLGKIIERASGLNLEEFSRDYLYHPLGIFDFSWVYIQPDLIGAHGDARLRPRDMAKLGQLYLNKGKWAGRQLLPEDWVKKSSEQFIQLSPNSVWARELGFSGYSYLWWTLSFDTGNIISAYCAAGWGGQYIYVVPELDMVVVFTGGNYEHADPVPWIMWNHIIPAVTNHSGFDDNEDDIIY